MGIKPHEVFNSKNRATKVITTTFKKDNVEKPIEIEWVVKPMSPRLMVKNYKNFAALENADSKDLTLEEQAEMMQKLAPLIDIILPACCIDPKIVFEGETGKGQIHIDDLDMETLMKLFSGIFEASGITEKTKEEREDLKKAPSLKLSPPSVSTTKVVSSHTKS